MNQNLKDNNKLFTFISRAFSPFIPVVKSRYFYYSLLTLIAGLELNVASQTYLHNYITSGKTLPMLSDLILDKLPVIDVSLIYDIVALIPILLTIFYVFHK